MIAIRLVVAASLVGFFGTSGSQANDAACDGDTFTLGSVIYVIDEAETLGIAAATAGQSLDIVVDLYEGTNPDAVKPGERVPVYVPTYDDQNAIQAACLPSTGLTRRTLYYLMIDANQALSAVAEHLGVDENDLSPVAGSEQDSQVMLVVVNSTIDPMASLPVVNTTTSTSVADGNDPASPSPSDAPAKSESTTTITTTTETSQESDSTPATEAADERGQSAADALETPDEESSWRSWLLLLLAFLAGILATVMSVRYSSLVQATVLRQQEPSPKTTDTPDPEDPSPPTPNAPEIAEPEDNLQTEQPSEPNPPTSSAKAAASIRFEEIELAELDPSPDREMEALAESIVNGVFELEETTE